MTEISGYDSDGQVAIGLLNVYTNIAKPVAYRYFDWQWKIDLINLMFDKFKD